MSAVRNFSFTQHSISRGDAMDPLKVSAQFAAYVWFSDTNQGPRKTQQAAVQFAKENWPMFLPLAHEGLGRLLIEIAGPHRARGSRIRQRVPAAIKASGRKLALAG